MQTKADQYLLEARETNEKLRELLAKTIADEGLNEFREEFRDAIFEALNLTNSIKKKLTTQDRSKFILRRFP